MQQPHSIQNKHVHQTNKRYNTTTITKTKINETWKNNGQITRIVMYVLKPQLEQADRGTLLLDLASEIHTKLGPRKSGPVKRTELNNIFAPARGCKGPRSKHHMVRENVKNQEPNKQNVDPRTRSPN